MSNIIVNNHPFRLGVNIRTTKTYTNSNSDVNNILKIYPNVITYETMLVISDNPVSDTMYRGNFIYSIDRKYRLSKSDVQLKTYNMNKNDVVSFMYSRINTSGNDYIDFIQFCIICSSVDTESVIHQVGNVIMENNDVIYKTIGILNNSTVSNGNYNVFNNNEIIDSEVTNGDIHNDNDGGIYTFTSKIKDGKIEIPHAYPYDLILSDHQANYKYRIDNVLYFDKESNDIDITIQYYIDHQNENVFIEYLDKYHNNSSVEKNIEYDVVSETTYPSKYKKYIIPLTSFNNIHNRIKDTIEYDDLSTNNKIKRTLVTYTKYINSIMDDGNYYLVFVEGTTYNSLYNISDILNDT